MFWLKDPLVCWVKFQNLLLLQCRILCGFRNLSGAWYSSFSFLFSNSYMDPFVEGVSWYSQAFFVGRRSTWFLIASSSLCLASQLSLAFNLQYKANRISSTTRSGESNGHNNYSLMTRCRLGVGSETTLVYLTWSSPYCWTLPLEMQRPAVDKVPYIIIYGTW